MAAQRGAFREAPDVFFVFFKGCLFKEKLSLSTQFYSGDAKMKKSTTQLFSPSTKGFVGSKGEIAAYCSLPSKLASSFATAFILGMAAVRV